MKSIRQIFQESNSISGIRGLGNVTGDLSIDENNPHIDRVIQGAEENNQEVKKFIDKHNNTTSLDDVQMDVKTGYHIKSKVNKNSIIMEAQDNEPPEITQAREDYKAHTKEIHRLGKSMGDVRNKNIQSQIDKHQDGANRAQKIFRSWEIRQAQNKVAAERLAGKRFDEEAPANAAGGGQVAGLGQTTAGKPANFAEPGVSSKTKYKELNAKQSPVMGDILRRPMLSTLKENRGMFAGHITHKVPRDVYSRIVHEKAKGKHWRKYLGEHELTLGIREYANRNPNKPVIIEDETTGYMCYARYGRK